MALDNKATPKYYGAFKADVEAGKIPVCKEIKLEMKRIDKLIADPKYYYSEHAVDGFIKFCESELTLRNGEDLRLMDSFKLWAEQVLGWYFFEEKSVFVPDENGGHVGKKKAKKRLTQKQFLIVARGAAKSMYASCFQSYTLCVDTSTTQQIVVAPTMRQTEETIFPIETAILRSRGSLFKFLTAGNTKNTRGSLATQKKLWSTKKGIQNFLTNSIIEARPMSINKLQGLCPKIATVDEWLSGDIKEDTIGSIEQGASKNDDYLIIATSSEGTKRNGPGDTIKMELESILKGDYVNPRVSIWYYKLDDVKEVAEPRMWIKANPNIGQTVSYVTYQQDVERAEKVPSARNDILAKRFNLPMEGLTYFFTYNEIQLHDKNYNFDGMICSMGADLSRGDDFCAFTFLFPLGDGTYGVKSRAYISTYTLDKLPLAARQKYQEFMDEGSLEVLEGTVLDMETVYDDLDNFIASHDYDVSSFGYDPYNAKFFVDRWVTENGEYGVTKVIQGARTESVPLGEIKALAGERSLLFDQSILKFTMGNCIVSEDTNGNRKLHKMKREDKIDSVSALMDAWVAYKRFREVFD